MRQASWAVSVGVALALMRSLCRGTGRPRSQPQRAIVEPCVFAPTRPLRPCVGLGWRPAIRYKADIGRLPESATTGRSPHSPKAVSHTPDLPEPTGRARWSPKDRRRAWLGSPLKRSQCCRAPVAPRQRASPNGTETTVLQPEPLAGGVSPNCMVPRANRRNSQLRMGSPVLRSAT